MKYYLEGLDCANCAAKIESALSKFQDVSQASVNFATKRLVVVPAAGADATELEQKIRAKVKELEPEVEVMDASAVRKNLDKGAARQHCHDHGCCAVDDHAHEESHSHGQEHAHDHKDGAGRSEVIRLAAGAAVFFLTLFVPIMAPVKLGLYIVSYLVIGGDILWRAVKNILRGQVFDENFLMAVASVGAFLIGEYPEGVAVMLFYQVGELMQSYAVGKSRRSITELMDIRPDYANVKRNGAVLKVSPDDVRVGETIVIRPGEKIPLDGIVEEGVSTIDTRALTGESVPRDAQPGGAVLSGCVNINGLISVKVTKESSESTVSKILELVENAGDKKARSEQFITKFARYYTPIVVGVAVLLAVLPPLILKQAFSDWIYRALVFLVISCPCALVISVPLSFFAGIGGASRQGILLKGSNFMEALTRVRTVAFDKTGTLTKGVFSVQDVQITGLEKEEAMELAAYAERHSSHPIAMAVREYYGKPLEEGAVESVEEIAGHGVKAVVRGRTVFAGNAKLMEAEHVAFQPIQAAGTILYLAVDGAYAGYLLIADALKDDAKAAIERLKQNGITKTVMLTGDSEAAASAVAQELGISEYHAQLLPGDKVEYVSRLMKELPGGEKLAFVGDGINDAPVLTGADIGIAMGGLGSDAAIEAADVVIMNDAPSKIATVIQISRKTLRIVKQNIVFALAMKVLFLSLGAFGIATMWEAVFADVGVALLAILNAIRAMRIQKD